MIAEIIAAATLGSWLYFFTARGNFWQIGPAPKPARPADGKSVCAIIPARNEEAVIGQAVASLANQAGHIIVVDDHSSDRTAEIAREHGATVVRAGPLPAGWSGKLWAISEGLKYAAKLEATPAPDYWLLTDADIVHGPQAIAELVARAETRKLDLVSYMVKLHCRGLAETLAIPAFVFFFFMLYPPLWILQRGRRTAAAAGGCMLVRPSTLQRIGGIESIRGEIIDDCALARAIKRSGGAIWLSITEETRSIRKYHTFAQIRAMISRTAFAQLRHSAVLLALTIIGMAVVYLAPPLLLVSGKPLPAIFGLSSWILMMIAYAPALKFYGRSVLWAPLLPVVALIYMFATLESAAAYWSGRGGVWKERVQDTN